MTGQGPAQANGDYEEEGGHEDHGHDHGEEETCESCGGMMEEGHACGESVEEDEIDDGEAVEEDQDMYQREEEVAEDEFAGDYATGEAGQWRNKGPKAHKPATIGDLVGEGQEDLDAIKRLLNK